MHRKLVEGIRASPLISFMNSRKQVRFADNEELDQVHRMISVNLEE